MTKKQQAQLAMAKMMIQNINKKIAQGEATEADHKTLERNTKVYIELTGQMPW